MAQGVLLVGCGNMGYAMLSGWLAAGSLDAADLAVVEPNPDLRDRAAGKGVAVFADAAALPQGLDPKLVIFAVKPQAMRDVVPAYRHFCAGGATFLSIAAGTGMALLEELLDRGARVARCMPNTPAAIGKGMMVLVANGQVPDEVKAFMRELLSASGRVAEINDEALMDAVTAVSGSGPAYLFHFIECLSHAGRKAGLPDETAALLAMQTAFGAACLAAAL